MNLSADSLPLPKIAPVVRNISSVAIWEPPVTGPSPAIINIFFGIFFFVPLTMICIDLGVFKIADKGKAQRHVQYSDFIVACFTFAVLYSLVADDSDQWGRIENLAAIIPSGIAPLNYLLSGASWIYTKVVQPLAKNSSKYLFIGLGVGCLGLSSIAWYAHGRESIKTTLPLWGLFILGGATLFLTPALYLLYDVPSFVKTYSLVAFRDTSASAVDTCTSADCRKPTYIDWKALAQRLVTSILGMSPPSIIFWNFLSIFKVWQTQHLVSANYSALLRNSLWKTGMFVLVMYFLLIGISVHLNNLSTTSRFQVFLAGFGAFAVHLFTDHDAFKIVAKEWPLMLIPLPLILFYYVYGFIYFLDAKQRSVLIVAFMSIIYYHYDIISNLFRDLWNIHYQGILENYTKTFGWTKWEDENDEDEDEDEDEDAKKRTYISSQKDHKDHFVRKAGETKNIKRTKGNKEINKSLY